MNIQSEKIDEERMTWNVNTRGKYGKSTKKIRVTKADLFSQKMMTKFTTIAKGVWGNERRYFRTDPISFSAKPT
jgi:hypothetical protein